MSTPGASARNLPLRALLSFAIAFLVSALLAALPVDNGLLRAEESADTGLPPLALSFDGKSTELISTQIVPTLDTPVEPRKNVIYCASFTAAWKGLQNDLVKEDVSLLGAEKACARLNAAPDPKAYIPEESLYTAAGWVNEGIIKTITDALRERFPEKPAPEFPGIARDSFLAYAYLEANVKFTLPFFDNRKPLLFTDSRNVKMPVRSFGLRPEDTDRYAPLRRQVAILCNNWTKESHEWIVDLCTKSEPSQVIVACVPPKATLAETLAYVRQCVDGGAPEESESLDIFGILLVPDFFWKIEHHFSELEAKPFANASFSAWRIDVAQQDISFRLDKSGAELKSEAKVYAKGLHIGPIDLYHFIADRPFLVIMKERSATEPYFVMWVDNAELLQKW